MPPKKTTKRKEGDSLDDPPSAKRQKVSSPEDEFELTPSQRSRRASRGLRQFSHKVCEKVQQKGTTTYTDVAKELVDEYSGGTNKDAKNIRRRVYDALNVLLAMDIISKEKKQITWRGYPENFHHKKEALERQRDALRRNIEKYSQQYKELLSQNRALSELYSRNANNMDVEEQNKVKMPFIIVHTSKETTIECQMDSKATEVFFNFSEPFEIHNDSELLMHIFEQGFDSNDLEGSPGIDIAPDMTPVNQRKYTAHSLSPGRALLFGTPIRTPSRNENLIPELNEGIPFSVEPPVIENEYIAVGNGEKPLEDIMNTLEEG